MEPPQRVIEPPQRVMEPPHRVMVIPQRVIVCPHRVIACPQRVMVIPQRVMRILPFVVDGNGQASGGVLRLVCSLFYILGYLKFICALILFNQTVKQKVNRYFSISIRVNKSAKNNKS